MKYALSALLPLAVSGLGGSPQFEIFWVTSTNGRIPDDDRPWTERRAINRFRNTFLVPRIKEWAAELDTKWHWMWYGENTFSPCWVDAGSFDSFDELSDYMAEIGEDTPKDMNQGDGSLNHVGYGTVAYAMSQADPDRNIWIVVWENMVIETLDVKPYPTKLEMDDMCYPGQTGQISYEMFKEPFKTANHRLFMINYSQSGALNSYDKVFDSQLDSIPRQFEYMPTENDYEGSNTNYWNTKSDSVSTSMQTFFARGAARELDEANFTDPDTRQKWVDENWPAFIEKYGKNPKKSWKSFFHLSDTHPLNAKAFRSFLDAAKNGTSF